VAVALLGGWSIPAPAVAEQQSATGTVTWTAEFCPDSPTDPTGLATVSSDCYSQFPDHANFVASTTTSTATAPAFWAYSGTNDVLFNGAEPDTDVATTAWTMAGNMIEQVESLLNLVSVQGSTRVNGDRVHATATARAAGQTKEQTVAVGLFCSEEGCVERELNEGLSGCLGCVNPLAYSTSFYGDGSATDYNQLENFEPRRSVVLYNDPRYKSGGPGKVTGSASFTFHVQTKKPNQYVNVHATSALYTAGPASGTNTKIKSMEAWAGGQDSTNLVRWSPDRQQNWGTRDTIEIGATLSFKAANFSIKKSWDRHEGVIGAMNDAGHHVMTWKHANKKGTAQSRSVTGVQIYETPSGKSGNVGIGAAVASN
jgi:hypothetical protein